MKLTKRSADVDHPGEIKPPKTRKSTTTPSRKLCGASELMVSGSIEEPSQGSVQRTPGLHEFLKDSRVLSLEQRLKVARATWLADPAAVSGIEHRHAIILDALIGFAVKPPKASTQDQIEDVWKSIQFCLEHAKGIDIEPTTFRSVFWAAFVRFMEGGPVQSHIATGILDAILKLQLVTFTHAQLLMFLQSMLNSSYDVTDNSRTLFVAVFMKLMEIFNEELKFRPTFVSKVKTAFCDTTSLSGFANLLSWSTENDLVGKQLRQEIGTLCFRVFFGALEIAQLMEITRQTISTADNSLVQLCISLSGLIKQLSSSTSVECSQFLGVVTLTTVILDACFRGIRDKLVDHHAGWRLFSDCLAACTPIANVNALVIVESVIDVFHCWEMSSVMDDKINDFNDYFAGHISASFSNENTMLVIRSTDDTRTHWFRVLKMLLSFNPLIIQNNVVDILSFIWEMEGGDKDRSNDTLAIVRNRLIHDLVFAYGRMKQLDELLGTLAKVWKASAESLINSQSTTRFLLHCLTDVMAETTGTVGAACFNTVSKTFTKAWKKLLPIDKTTDPKGLTNNQLSVCQTMSQVLNTICRSASPQQRLPSHGNTFMIEYLATGLGKVLEKSLDSLSSKIDTLSATTDTSVHRVTEIVTELFSTYSSLSRINVTLNRQDVELGDCSRNHFSEQIQMCQRIRQCASTLVDPSKKTYNWCAMRLLLEEVILIAGTPSVDKLSDAIEDMTTKLHAVKSCKDNIFNGFLQRSLTTLVVENLSLLHHRLSTKCATTLYTMVTDYILAQQTEETVVLLEVLSVSECQLFWEVFSQRVTEVLLGTESGNSNCNWESIIPNKHKFDLDTALPLFDLIVRMPVEHCVSSLENVSSLAYFLGAKDWFNNGNTDFKNRRKDVIAFYISCWKLLSISFASKKFDNWIKTLNIQSATVVNLVEIFLRIASDDLPESTAALGGLLVDILSRILSTMLPSEQLETVQHILMRMQDVRNLKAPLFLRFKQRLFQSFVKMLPSFHELPKSNSDVVVDLLKESLRRMIKTLPKGHALDTEPLMLVDMHSTMLMTPQNTQTDNATSSTDLINSIKDIVEKLETLDVKTFSGIIGHITLLTKFKPANTEEHAKLLTMLVDKANAGSIMFLRTGTFDGSLVNDDTMSSVGSDLTTLLKLLIGDNLEIVTRLIDSIENCLANPNLNSSCTSLCLVFITSILGVLTKLELAGVRIILHRIETIASKTTALLTMVQFETSPDFANLLLGAVSALLEARKPGVSDHLINLAVNTVVSIDPRKCVNHSMVKQPLVEGTPSYKLSLPSTSMNPSSANVDPCLKPGQRRLHQTVMFAEVFCTQTSVLNACLRDFPSAISGQAGTFIASLQLLQTTLLNFLKPQPVQRKGTKNSEYSGRGHLVTNVDELSATAVKYQDGQINSTYEKQIHNLEVKCAQSLTRVYALISRRDSDFKQVVPYLLVAYVTQMGRSGGAVPYAVRQQLLFGGIYLLIKILDDTALTFLRNRLEPDVQESFARIYDDYVKYHKYSGFV